MTIKQDRIEHTLQELAARFINTENIGDGALITVTRASLSENLRKAVVFVTVLPEDTEEQVVERLNRRRGAFSKHVVKQSKIRYIPSVRFALDQGERNRQRLEELLQ